MSQIKVQGNVSGTGVFTVASPNSNTDRTFNLPDHTGTLLTSNSPASDLPSSIKGPAFYASVAGQSISNTTWTKLSCVDTGGFDTNNNYDNTNYRFTPTIAGYYQVNGRLSIVGTSASGVLLVAIYKNGSRTFDGNQIPFASTEPKCIFSNLIYMNGSTDYIEIYGYQSSGTSKTMDGDFSSALVRAA